MGLLRGIWNAITTLRNIVFNLLFLAILIVVVVGLTSQDGIQVPESGALVLESDGGERHLVTAGDVFAE